MKTLILSITVAAALFISSCNSDKASNNTSGNKPADPGQVQKTAVVYTCTMHPEVISDKPGKCPKCNMALVQKDKESTEDHSGHQH
jgi:hypothetical protein